MEGEQDASWLRRLLVIDSDIIGTTNRRLFTLVVNITSVLEPV